MIPTMNIPREKFPKSEKTSEGMITLEVSCDNNEMRYIRDIKYIGREEADLFLQLILPDNPSEKTPIIVYITGSAFHWQDIPCTIPRLCVLANKGFAIASVQYRGVEAAPFPAQMLDAKAAVRFIKSTAKNYGLSPENVYLMGDSSGGHTALMAGLTAATGDFEEDIYSDFSSDVKGIIDYYGPTDITKMCEEPSNCDHASADCPEGYLIGRKPLLENLSLAEPINVMKYISKECDIPPVLIFHGTNDETVPFGQSCMLYDKLKECGKRAKFYAVEGAHHGGREFWSEQVLGIVENFVKNDVL